MKNLVLFAQQRSRELAPPAHCPHGHSSEGWVSLKLGAGVPPGSHMQVAGAKDRGTTGGWDRGVLESRHLDSGYVGISAAGPRTCRSPKLTSSTGQMSLRAWAGCYLVPAPRPRRWVLRCCQGHAHSTLRFSGTSSPYKEGTQTARGDPHGPVLLGHGRCRCILCQLSQRRQEQRN